MTVNITINADALELTQVDGMTRIVCNGELANSEKETRDTLTEHKAKTKAAEDAVCAQIDKMTKDWEERKDNTESDWIVRRKLKPQRLGEAAILEQGLYFRREVGSEAWIPWVYDYWEGIHYLNETEILGPITPEMFL